MAPNTKKLWIGIRKQTCNRFAWPEKKESNTTCFESSLYHDTSNAFLSLEEIKNYISPIDDYIIKEIEIEV
jgi:hypothetical protein